MKLRGKKIVHRAAGVVAGLLVCSAIASADVVLGEAATFGVDLDTAVHSDGTQAFSASEGDMFQSSNSPFDVSQSFASQSNSFSWADASLSTTSGTGHIFSDVDGTSGTKHAGADSTVNGIDYSFGDIHFTADQAESQVSISGTQSLWTRTTSTSLVDPVLTIGGVNVLIPNSPTSNDVIYNQDGILVVLNGIQSQGGTDGFVEASAITFSFSGFQPGNGLTFNFGGVRFGAAEANLQSTPEPSTVLAFATLAGGLLLRRRRRS